LKHVLPSVRVWVALAAITTAIALLLSYRSIQESQISTAAVGHTQQTLSAVVALEGAIADLIFASGEQAITLATDSAVKRIDDLSALTFDNERQQQRLTRLRSEIDAVVRARRHGPDNGIETRPQAVVPQRLSRTLREIRVEDGYTFIRNLCAEGLRQPVAALTAHAHETDRASVLASGFDVHLRKPIEPRALAQAVAALVASTRACPN
jgi:CheY-like chemotaxis protein